MWTDQQALHNSLLYAPQESYSENVSIRCHSMSSKRSVVVTQTVRSGRWSQQSRNVCAALLRCHRSCHPSRGVPWGLRS